MNPIENKAKLQIVEKIKDVTNILVTVSKDPSVDDLSAALGLTLFLNKMGKHATAVFSGAIPPAITFLDPDKVFENKPDSLRDFIIALDKEKADHLRYKVEGDLVKIFITPYRTTITADDLEFSQGDYNIELVLALGVDNQEHLDTALASQADMLHDVTIATFSVGENASNLGSVDWREETASSLSEMIANLTSSFKDDKATMDKQIATALLTGIVAATDRFSNVRTSSTVMSVAAELMAAGADQQLIAAKLQESHDINSLPVSTTKEQEASKPQDIPMASELSQEPEVASTLPSDLLQVSHEEPAEKPSDEDKPSEGPDETPPPVTPSNPSGPSEPTVGPVESTASKAELQGEPLLGGILNATSDQAAEDAKRELDEQQNKTILSHSYLSGSDPNLTNAINGVGQTESNQMVDIFSQSINPTDANSPAPTTPVITEPAAPNEVAEMPLPPPVPDFSTLPPSAPIPPVGTPPAPDVPSTPNVPGVSTLPPEEPGKSDPSQFQIPM